MYRCDSGGLYTLFCGFIFHGKVSIIPIFSLSISEYVGDLVFIFSLQSSSIYSSSYGDFLFPRSACAPVSLALNLSRLLCFYPGAALMYSVSIYLKISDLSRNSQCCSTVLSCATIFVVVTVVKSNGQCIIYLFGYIIIWYHTRPS